MKSEKKRVKAAEVKEYREGFRTGIKLAQQQYALGQKSRELFDHISALEAEREEVLHQLKLIEDEIASHVDESIEGI